MLLLPGATSYLLLHIGYDGRRISSYLFRAAYYLYDVRMKPMKLYRQAHKHIGIHK